MELNNFTNEELDSLRIEVAIEQERRQSLATIPAQINDLAKKFVDGGGDISDISLEVEISGDSA